jgi:hypothetical protein
MGPEFSAIAATAIDIPIRSIVQVGGVQRATAVSTVEATSMPDLKDETGQKILGNPSLEVCLIVLHADKIKIKIYSCSISCSSSALVIF